MRILYLVVLCHVSAQLQCDKSIVRATVGGRFNVACTYNTNQFRFSKKYWCLGESKSSCKILMDTDGFTKAELKSRVQITETYRTFHILMTGLQVGDSGVYWAAIDKMYADIMFKIQVEVKEDFNSYDCRTTTPPITTTMTAVEVFSSTLVTQTSGYKKHSRHVNQTRLENFLLRSWSGVPLWYDIVRWILFTLMMVTTGLVHMRTQAIPSGHRLTHKHI